MTLFFPDLNVWLALADSDHEHNREAWHWFRQLPDGSRLAFSWYTQLGMLRLLTNQSVMGDGTLTVQKAWEVYDQCLGDPRVAFHPEPRGLDRALRDATAPFGEQHASKWIGDCYLLAWAEQADAVLVTFDRALHEFARKRRRPAIIPS